MGVAVITSIIGDGAITAKLGQASVLVDRSAATAVDKTAAGFTRLVKANASGRPGPNAPTGAYRASWQTEGRGGAGVHSRAVGTNAVQAHRLEYGFTGVDSLGRVVDAPPYPHFGPAAAATEVLFDAAMGAVLRDPALW